MKKIFFVSGVLFLVPALASAGMMVSTKCGGYGYSAMSHGFIWMGLLVIILLAIWTVVGALASVWLWQHVSEKKTARKNTSES